MNNNDRNLLFKDLCGRLPYNVLVKSKKYSFPIELRYLTLDKLPDVKPYLRPMSSMTGEEYEDFVKVLKRSMVCRKCYDWHEHWIQSPSIEEWLNSHHFDYRGLIPRDLPLKHQKECMMPLLTHLPNPVIIATK